MNQSPSARTVGIHAHATSATSAGSSPHACAECGGPKAIFIEQGRDLCRNCAHIPDQHRPALNALLNAGLIYPKETP